MHKSAWFIPLPLLFFPVLLWPHTNGYWSIIGGVLLFASIVVWVLSGDQQSKRIAWSDYRARIQLGYHEIKQRFISEPRFRKLIMAFSTTTILLTLAAPPVGITIILLSIHFILSDA